MKCSLTHLQFPVIVSWPLSRDYFNTSVVRGPWGTEAVSTFITLSSSFGSCFLFDKRRNIFGEPPVSNPFETFRWLRGSSLVDCRHVGKHRVPGITLFCSPWTPVSLRRQLGRVSPLLTLDGLPYLYTVRVNNSLGCSRCLCPERNIILVPF